MRPAPDGGKTPGAVRAARRAVGDPRLVRAGQGLVPTPRAVELREEVGELLRGCENVLRPGAGFDPVHLERTFTVQTSDVVPAPVVGVARGGHPLFEGRITARRFAAADHIGISRRGKQLGPIDTALAERGLRRRVAVVVPSHTSAMLLARDSGLVSLGLADWLPQTLGALGLRTFPIPLELAQLELGMAWHPRNSADPGHRWFREHLAAAVRQARSE
ncbi:LysR substrate binding domain-containing protein [Streptomyces sp. 1114.5]|uniref:LysR substrate-binding domain-containing protein n=1 Tax=Streptomyces sp. 1114.5 TaxID=1938830 RepID=UPI000EAC4BFA|nr:LysR substrate-binding domain-containing protein [Streptomyces sp. 1114.5]RKT19103.1 LysR substrate binding domain-containing protein [Streptomyces sp. 1114.5]